MILRHGKKIFLGMSLCEVEVILHHIKTNQGILLHKILFDKKNIMMNTKLRYIDRLVVVQFVSILFYFLAGNKNIKQSFLQSNECFLPTENSRMRNKIKTNQTATSHLYKIVVNRILFGLNLITDSNPFLV